MEYCNSNNKELPEGIGLYKYRSGQFGDLPLSLEEIIIHCKASTISLCYETVDAIIKSFSDKIDYVDYKLGFKYQDGRDLSGFLDGTVNTVGELKRKFAAINKTGGSFLIHQRWEHNLDLFNKFSLKEQENIFGRKKDNSEEQSKMLETAHVKRMRDDNFNRIPIVRQSMPFFDQKFEKNGLLFIAYSNNVSKFDQMLDRMVDSKSDAVMRYSKCVSGNYFYLPSINELQTIQ